jgi:2-dehydro-3-deoxygalactonokinase
MPAPHLIALDWGTTSLRAYLLDARAAVIESREAPLGVMRLSDTGFPGAFHEITAGWPTPTVPTIAAGMVGSAQGWVQAPYVPCPAGVDDLARALTPLPDGRGRVVPGLTSSADPPDVMRGEETQIVGALALHPALAASSCLLLPGTHAKWARVVAGRVADFRTFMTGELFAVLRDHSILGRPARGTSPAATGDAFATGVRAAQEGSGGLAPLLFTARTHVLAGRVGPAASLDYLSGLLVGDELRSGLAAFGAPDALVGDPALCARYSTALAILGRAAAPVVDHAASAGLWRIAERAHIIPA